MECIEQRGAESSGRQLWPSRAIAWKISIACHRMAPSTSYPVSFWGSDSLMILQSPCGETRRGEGRLRLECPDMKQDPLGLSALTKLRSPTNTVICGGAAMTGLSSISALVVSRRFDPDAPPLSYKYLRLSLPLVPRHLAPLRTFNAGTI